MAIRTGRWAALAVCVGLAQAAIVPASAGSIYLGGIALGGSTPTLTMQSMQEQRYRGTIPQKYDFSCGSAALATLLTYNYGIHVTEQQVFKSMFEHGNKQDIERYGFSLLDLKQYLARKGVPSGGYRAPLPLLAKVGVPAIVLVNERGYHHFVVVEGIRDGRVLMADPATGMRSELVSSFESQWSGVFFLILTDAKRGQEAFNNPEKWAVAPRTPMAIARFAVDQATLLQQTAVPNLSRF